MFRFRYFKKFILPLSLSATALGVADQSGELGEKKKRPGDLSLYDEPEEKSLEEKENQSKLEKEIGKIREEVWVWYDNVKGYREKVVEVVVTAKEHSEVLVQSLRNDELPIPRSGAIAIGGLAGFTLGLRCGWIKRIFYGSTCAGIMTAICYPRETKELTQDALAVMKKYVLISYNFIYGVKPENLRLPSPSDFLGGSIEKKKDDISFQNTVSEKESPENLVGASPSKDAPSFSMPCDSDLSGKIDTTSSPLPSLSYPKEASLEQEKGEEENTPK